MESIGRYSAAIYRLSQSIFNNRLKELEMSSGQYDIFRTIAKNGGINQKDICDMLYIEKSTTAKAVKYLLSKGYIFNEPSAHDKRYSSLYVTEKGRLASVLVDNAFLDMLNIFSKDISDEMMEQTISVMKKVIRNLQEEKSIYIGE